MISEIFIAVTMFMNAGAILNFKLQKSKESFDFEEGPPTIGCKHVTLWNELK
eukprot:m.85102 g.85102  ORF g.85102 m.85102 type:complete len:52 (+) comp12995_c0_seq3:406-561(+)